MSRLERVIFLSKRDAIGPHMLGKAEKLLSNPNDFSNLDLNSLLEFHHIHQYFESGLFLSNWSDEQVGAYKQVVKDALAALRVFFSNLSAEQLIMEIRLLEFDNRESFWQLFSYFQLYKQHDRDVFISILNKYPRHIRAILHLELLVQFYNIELRSFLLTYEETAELLLAHYEQKHTNEPSNYHFPKSLSDADKEGVIESYLDSEEPNLNFVDLAKNPRTVKLSPKTRLKAKQVAATISEGILSGDNSMRIGVGATLANDQEEPVIFEKQENGDSMAVYGGKYLDALQTDQELFNVFSNLFLYTDEDGLISLVNKDSEMDVLEKIFMQSKSQYRKGVAFEHKNMLSLAQIGIFSHYLKNSGRSIEAIIESFVHSFFTGKLGMEGLVFKMPQPELGPVEKIRLTAPEMDYLLRQFKNFAADGEINHELLRLDSAQVYFSEMPSLVQKKYVFSNHETMRRLQHWFFDNNSILADRKSDIEDRQTLFYTLAERKTRKSDFEEYQLPYLDSFMNDGFLRVNNDGIIEMVDPAIIFVAGKLRANKYISYWHISQPFRQVLDRLIENGYLQVSNRLFTLDEVSYLNFYLNMKEFSNGKDLRNKYLHGSHNRDAKQSEIDYLYFLRTLILVLVKMKDDATIKLSYFPN